MILRPPFSPARDLVQAHLRLIATTDLHMALRAWDYVADRPHRGTGLLSAAPLIRALRAEAPAALVLDVGDLLQGNALADHLAEATGPEPHALIAAMNRLGYDGGTLGNHDFDYGLPYLERALAQARFPVVSANLHRPDGSAWRPPWALIATRVTDAAGTGWPLTVGIIGFAPPQTVQWARHHVAGRLIAQDIIAAAQAELPRLRAAGAEVIVALCHSGMAETQATPGMENAAIPLAALDGIDAILMGHTHEVFPAPGAFGPAVDPVAGRLHGKPAVQAGYQGSHLGVIDLLVQRGLTGWRPVADAAAVLPIPARPAAGRQSAADRALDRATLDAHRATLAKARHTVGQSDRPLNTFFTLVAPDAGLQLLADAQRAAARPALAGTPWADLPLISAVAPNRVGGPGGPGNYLDTPAGPIAMRHLGALSPFPNTLCLLELTGATLLDWLERAVSGYGRIAPGMQDQPLLDPRYPAYVFDLLDGLRYTVDPTAPARTDPAGRVVNPDARRISAVKVGDRPLDPAETVILATNAYRAGGGGGFAAATRGRIIAEVPVTGRDAMLAHLATARPRPPQPTWHFAPLPGTAAWFDTSPTARGHIPPGCAITDIGAAPGGFRRFRLDF